MKLAGREIFLLMRMLHTAMLLQGADFEGKWEQAAIILGRNSMFFVGNSIIGRAIGFFEFQKVPTLLH